MIEVLCKTHKVKLYKKTFESTILKRNQEIVAIQYAIEVNSLNKKVEDLEAIVKFELK